MIRYYHHIFKRKLCVIIVATPICFFPNFASSNVTQDNVPALLKFAERYAQQGKLNSNSGQRTKEQQKYDYDDSKNRKKIIRQRECVTKSNELILLSDKNREINELTKHLAEKDNLLREIKQSTSQVSYLNTQTKIHELVDTFFNARNKLFPYLSTFVNHLYHVDNDVIISLVDSLNHERLINKTLLSEIQQLNLQAYNDTSKNNDFVSDELLQKEMKNLKNEYDLLLTQKSEKDKLIESLYAKLKNYEKQKVTVLEMNSTVSSLETELLSLKNNYQDTKVALEVKSDEVNNLKEAISKNVEKIDFLEKQNTTLSGDLASSKVLNEHVESNPQLKTLADLFIDSKSLESIKASYSIGTYIGEDILILDQEHEKLGLETNKLALLSGIIDAFGNNFKIPLQDRKKLSTEFDNRYELALNKKEADDSKESNSFIEKISKDPKITKSDFGFWFETLKPGRGKNVTHSTEVELSVKEMLSDGTVIQDMGTTGKTLIKSVDELPPLFKNSVLLMKKGGKIKIIVPPELAYGEKGLEPNIPANSVMLYEITLK